MVFTDENYDFDARKKESASLLEPIMSAEGV